MEHDIRQLTIDDFEAISSLWLDAGLTHRPVGRDSRVHIEQELMRADTAFFGLYENTHLLAVGLATYDGRKGWINRVAVDPDRRGEGLAGKIIKACEDFLYSFGCEVIGCLIEDYNTPSMALFAKHGYISHEDINYFSKRKSADS